MSLIPAITSSNDQHRHWPWRCLQARLGDLQGKTIAILGLVYTPNTDTLRRSAAVELCRKLLETGATVKAFDPAVKALPPALAAVALTGSPSAALHGADAAVVCTEWPEFRQAAWSELLRTMRQPLVVDANGFLEKELKDQPRVEHLCVGRAP